MAYRPYYRPSSNIVRTARYQNPHDIVSMHAGSEEAQRQARFARISIITLLEDAIRDESDAINKYTYILGELNKYIGAYGTVKEREYSDVEVIEHIRAQEVHHRALLEKLKGYHEAVRARKQ